MCIRDRYHGIYHLHSNIKNIMTNSSKSVHTSFYDFGVRRSFFHIYYLQRFLWFGAGWQLRPWYSVMNNPPLAAFSLFYSLTSTFILRCPFLKLYFILLNNPFKWSTKTSPIRRSNYECCISTASNEYSLNAVSYTHLDVYKRQIQPHAYRISVCYRTQNSDIVRPGCLAVVQC